MNCTRSPGRTNLHPIATMDVAHTFTDLHQKRAWTNDHSGHLQGARASSRPHPTVWHDASHQATCRIQQKLKAVPNIQYRKVNDAMPKRLCYTSYSYQAFLSLLSRDHPLRSHHPWRNWRRDLNHRRMNYEHMTKDKATNKGTREVDSDNQKTLKSIFIISGEAN